MNETTYYLGKPFDIVFNGFLTCSLRISTVILLLISDHVCYVTLVENSCREMWFLIFYFGKPSCLLSNGFLKWWFSVCITIFVLTTVMVKCIVWFFYRGGGGNTNYLSVVFSKTLFQPMPELITYFHNHNHLLVLTLTLKP